MTRTRRTALAPAPEALAAPARLQPNYRDKRRRFGGNSYRHVIRHAARMAQAGCLTPLAPAPAACSANSAAPQLESRSNIPDISSSSDQAASLPDSSAPPGHLPEEQRG